MYLEGPHVQVKVQFIFNILQLQKLAITIKQDNIIY